MACTGLVTGVQPGLLRLSMGCLGGVAGRAPVDMLTMILQHDTQKYTENCILMHKLERMQQACMQSALFACRNHSLPCKASICAPQNRISKLVFNAHDRNMWQHAATCQCGSTSVTCLTLLDLGISLTMLKQPSQQLDICHRI